ncbi:FG-GAP-like repeat-containing protein [Emticicia sp. 17c]|uniref:FG-GAP-like repeat-containing protein n=1 Tax=Emticicia sp. 17c TaxID=3127704 RepID=UPI00301D0F0D
MKSLPFSIVVFLLIFSCKLLAQTPGLPDLAFNTADKGLNITSATKIHVQPDGKIIAAGQLVYMSKINGVESNGIVRFNADATIDTTFDVGSGITSGKTIQAMKVQSDGKILIAGKFTSYNGVTRNGLARINADGSLDTTFNPATEEDADINAIVEQTDGKIIIAGIFSSYGGVARKNIARLNTDGSLDTTFDPGTGTDNGSFIYAVGIQQSGKIIIGGFFSSYNGTTANNIARLNTDGSIDTAFNSDGSGTDREIYTIEIQSDNKILIGGFFTTFNGYTRKALARLNADGSLDTDFVPININGFISNIFVQNDGKIFLGGLFSYNYLGNKNNLVRLTSTGATDIYFTVTGTGTNNGLNTINVLSDGKVIIGGSFTTYGGSNRMAIARLNTSGTLDSSYAPNTGFNSYIYTISVQNDNKIIVGGSFTRIGNGIKNFITRLNMDGTTDTTFNAGTGSNNYVMSSLVLPDNKILMAGLFTSYGGVVMKYITRLNTDGTVDPDFATTGPNGPVYGMALQADGKILIGGSFNNVNGTTRNNFARLNNDGTLDTSFNPGNSFNNYVNNIAVQSDGKILVVGNFQSFDSKKAVRIARLNSDGSLDTDFNTGLGFNGEVYKITLQKDGKILVGGLFTSYNGTTANYIIRLNTDGTIDTTFAIGTGAQYFINTITVQDDKKIILGGGFNNFNGFSTLGLIRLNVNGSVDSTFNTGVGTNNSVFITALQNDGNLLVGGAFTTYNGIRKNRLMRVYNCINPNISTQPQSQLVMQDTPANFSVEASGISVTYQWQEKTPTGTFTDIIGATESTLTLPEALLSKNTNQYRVVVNSGSCAIISDTAILSVRPSPPVIHSYSPVNAPVGTSITITGRYFNNLASDNIVRFGSVQANVTAATDTTLTVVIPEGAMFAPVSVTNLGNHLTGYSNQIFPVTSTGSFDFIPPQDLKTPVGSQPKAILLSDIDSDGNADIISANYNSVSVFRNLSDSTTLSFAERLDLMVGSLVSQIDLKDMDGDGKQDLIVLMKDESALAILPNKSTTGNISFGTTINYSAGLNPYAMALGDLNNDGKPDLVISNYGTAEVADSTLSVYLNTSKPDSIRLAMPVFTSTKGLHPTALTIRDINADGLNDVIVINKGSNRVSVLTNESVLDTISFNDTLTLLSALNYPTALAIEDFDGDNRLDIAVSNAGTNTVSVFRNTVAGGFAKQNFETQLYPNALEIGDFDGDGKPDLAITNLKSNSLSILQNKSVNDTIKFVQAGNFTALKAPVAVAIGDINHDKKYDFITANSEGQRISVSLQKSCAYTENAGTQDNGLHFDGIDDYVQISNCSAKPLPLSEAITIEYWFKGTNMQSAVRLQTDTANAIIMGWQNAHHTIMFHGQIDSITVGAYINDGQWHHVAMSWEKGKANGFKSYLDGTLVTQKDATDMNLPPIETNWYLGSLWGNEEFMNGALDEVKIWNIARSETQIHESMKSDPTDTTGLLLHYAFRHGIASGNNTNLTQVKNNADSSIYTGYLRHFSLTGNTSNFIASIPDSPELAVAGDSVVCFPSGLNLTASGCEGTVTWSYQHKTGTSLTLQETGTYSISAICTVNGYPSRVSHAITGLTIYAKPEAPTITPPAETSVCAGDTLIITSNNCAGVIIWSTGATGSSLAITETGTYSISATCTVNGCVSEASAAIEAEIKAKPVAPTIIGAATVCAPTPVTLTANGCDGLVRWSDNSTGSSINITETGIYNVSATCTINGCTSNASDSARVEIKPKPASPTIEGSLIACEGDTITLNISDCMGGQVTWSTGATGSSLAITETGTYSVSAICTINGCASDTSTAVMVEIKTKPAAPIIQGGDTVCEGDFVPLTASGCEGLITWSNGETGNEISVSEAGTYSISATCTVNGCTSNASSPAFVTIKAKPSPPSIDGGGGSVCAPNTVTLTANGCNGLVTWSNSATGSSLTLSAAGVYVIKAVCTVNGCTSEESMPATAVIRARPEKPVITGTTAVCFPDSAILSVSGCTGSVLWSSGGSGSSITISNIGTYAISAICMANGCASESSSTVLVQIKAKPTAPTVRGGGTACAPDTVTLTASGCEGTINWSTNATGTSLTFASAGSYSITATCTVNGCISNASTPVTVNILALPAKPSITANNSSVCNGGNITLTASSCDGGKGTLYWTGGKTGTSVTVIPSKTSVYRVLCKTLAGCVSDSSDAFTPTVIDIPSAPVVQYKLINMGATATLTATCTVGRPVWYSSASGTTALATDTYTTPALTIYTVYYVACETNPGNAINCQSSRAAQVVNVDQFAITRQPEDLFVCTGQDAIFSVTTTGFSMAYQWQENRGNGWQNIIDGGIYSGTKTSSLKLTTPGAGYGEYRYRCVVTNTFPNGVPTSLTSTEVLLVVQNSAIANTLTMVNQLAGIVNTYQATTAITATNIIESNARVNYFAGNSITLSPGFEVKAGSYFQAKIQTSCANN